MRKEKQIALRSASAAREKLLLRPLADILRSMLEGLLEIAEAEVAHAGGFRGTVRQGQRYAANTLNLAHREIDRLTLWREEDETITRAGSSHQLTRVLGR